MKRLFLLVAVLLACGPHPPSPSWRLCDPFARHPMLGDACPKRFTTDGYACVPCKDDGACLDASSLMYCVGPAGCDDPDCPATTGAKR